jgi:hypothetical protein
MDLTAYLDRGLVPHDRMGDLSAAADQVATAPTRTVLADLTRILEARPLSMEDLLRLNVLLSQLYHAKPDIDGDHVQELRDLVSVVWENTRPENEGR